MRLKGQKQSQYLLDNTWVPKKKTPVGPGGSVQYMPWLEETPPSGAAATPAGGRGDFSRAEIQMIKSGATIKEILFMRAMEKQDYKGFSPYFNPNRR